MVWLFQEKTHIALNALERFYVLRAVRRYDTHGEIEIQAPAQSTAGVLLPGTIVWIDTPSQAYILDTVEIKEEEGRGDVLTATGFSASKLLARRITAAGTVVSGAAGAVVRNLVEEVFNESGRWFGMLDTSFPAIGEELDYERDPMQLDDAVLPLLRAGGIGIHSGFNASTRRLSLSLYQGQDHTVGSGSSVIFSPAYENIDGILYTDSTNDYRNVAYVIGEQVSKDSEERKITIIPEESKPTGYDRYEMIVNSNAKSEKVTITRYDESIDDFITYEESRGDYGQLVRSDGEQALAQRVRVNSANGQIVTSSKLYRLGVDYDLGDMVTFRLPAYGVEQNVRIQEIAETYENGVRTITAQFGDGLPTFTDKIKRRGG